MLHQEKFKTKQIEVIHHERSRHPSEAKDWSAEPVPNPSPEIAAIVLAIVGLAGILSNAVLSVAAIAVGAGLLVQGGAVAAEHKELIGRLAGATMEEVNLDTGISVELAGGLAAIVLGILSLLIGRRP